MTEYEHKAMGIDGPGDRPIHHQPWGPAVEFGALRPILTLEGKAFDPGRTETKAATGAPSRVEAVAEDEEVGADVPPPEALPEDTDAVTWMVVPEETLTPAMRRAAEIALLALEEELPGLPAGLGVRYIAPYDPSTYRLYAEIVGAPPATFQNARGTKGTYFGGTHPKTLWVSVVSDPTDVARATLHEGAHAWRQAKGVPSGWTRDALEEEADAIAAKLLPLVHAVADEEGGLSSWYRLR